MLNVKVTDPTPETPRSQRSPSLCHFQVPDPFGDRNLHEKLVVVKKRMIYKINKNDDIIRN